MLPILGKEFQGIKFNNGNKEKLLKDFPDKFVPELIHSLQVHSNDSTDFSSPHIRTSLYSSYPWFIAAYVIIMLGGIVSNIVMLVRLLKIFRRLRERKVNYTEYLFMANIAVLNILMCLVVMPLSLAIVLIQNWVFGKLLCYLAPIMQVS